MPRPPRHSILGSKLLVPVARLITGDWQLIPNVDSWIRTRIDAVLQTAALPLELSPPQRVAAADRGG
jgi:hypothetical protein